MLKLNLVYDAKNSGEFFEAVKKELYSNERSNTKIKLDKKTVVFDIEAKDVSSLKASFSSVTQLITINEKMNSISSDKK